MSRFKITEIRPKCAEKDWENRRYYIVKRKFLLFWWKEIYNNEFNKTLRIRHNNIDDAEQYIIDNYTNHDGELIRDGDIYKFTQYTYGCH